MVIPLYATTLRRHRPRLLAINEDLPSKPRYCPYPQTKRFRSSNSESTDLHVSSSQPVSPLTPLPNDTCGENGLAQREPRVILVPPPPGTLAVASLDLHSSLARDYRAVAKSVIIALKMDINLALSEQDTKCRDEARSRIEAEIPHFKHHEDHWGADILLRDQLKSMRDVNNKKGKKKKASGDDIVDT